MSKKFRRGMLLVVALFMVTGFVITLTSTPAAQAVAGPGVRTYYSNATYTTVVGRETYGCCGEYSFWGTKTKWSKFERFYCPDVLCPN